jgi:hypothetical protein
MNKTISRRLHRLRYQEEREGPALDALPISTRGTGPAFRRGVDGVLLYRQVV